MPICFFVLLCIAFLLKLSQTWFLLFVNRVIFDTQASTAVGSGGVYVKMR